MSGDRVRDDLCYAMVVGVGRNGDGFSRACGSMIYRRAAFQSRLKSLGILTEIVKDAGERGRAFGAEFFRPACRELRDGRQVNGKQVPF
jgi:hypothetical protein